MRPRPGRRFQLQRQSLQSYRGTMQGRTPCGDSATVIVTHQGLGRNRRIWLTFDGAIKTTVVMTDQEARELVRLVDAATARRARFSGLTARTRGAYTMPDLWLSSCHTP